MHRRPGVSRSVLVTSRHAGPAGIRPGDCPRCDDAALDHAAYVELLGWYLGDGHLARARRGVPFLRIHNDLSYPRANERIATLITRVRPRAIPCAQARDGCLITSAGCKHRTCLFPQHGPGREHERPIVLEQWRRELVEAHPRKRYDYPRWQFSNTSPHIRDLCCWARDLVDIGWRQSHRTMIRVRAWPVSMS